MKIVQALKKIKALKIKISDLTAQIRDSSVILKTTTPKYSDQLKTVREMIDSVRDSCLEISKLKAAIAKTNLETMLEIPVGGKNVKKSIFEWICRRQELCALEETSWQVLGENGTKPGLILDPQKPGERIVVDITRFYVPEEKDKMCANLKSEPATIDGFLEVCNAETDLIGI
jgi:hypothetical protein